MTLTAKSILLVCVATFIPVATGCTGLNKQADESTSPTNSTLTKWMPWKKDKGEEPEPYPNPVKLAAIWTPDTLVQTGRTPTRGFGGRLFFYDEKSRPVPVEGTLVVHGYDDLVASSGDVDAVRKATKRFEFTPEQFTRHFSQTDLGASYSVWIPWDAVGGESRKISLVASFKTADGATVQGVPATVNLAGSASSEEAVARAEQKLSPQYREFKQASASIGTRSSGLTTTTIRRKSQLNTQPSTHGMSSRSMIAAKKKTPSAEIRIAKQPASTSVVPASATMPAKR